MRYVYVCKTQDPKLECKSRIVLELPRGSYYLCGSYKKVNECWGDK